ncbi:MAG: hypothetical protein KAY28_01975 [Cloacibacterium sp.]|nr:hypothetical protein [Cloacibacterium sp.]
MEKILESNDFIDQELLYSNWLSGLVDIMEPKDAFLILGRATAKTSDFLAKRSQNVSYDMAGSFLALVADTYTNILKNISVALLEGWERNGWRKGTHYVVDDPPPKHFKLPYKSPHTYKHTISTVTGSFFNYISMDTPSSGAGNSYQHLFGDESKYIEKKRIDKLFPALRGPATLFGHSPYYLGATFTTDYPNIIMPGEYDWILERAKDMDLKQIRMLLQVSLDLNEARKDRLIYTRKKNARLIKIAENKIKKLSVLHHQLRTNSTFFYVASSFVNVDVLRLDFFKTSLSSLGEEEFNTSILSMPPKVEAGQKFYINLDTEKHIYDDGIIFENMYRFNTGDNAEVDSRDLRYCEINRPIEMGIDFGDMMSMVVGQTKMNDIYLLKNFYTLISDKETARHLANKFLNFFRNHQYKYIKMYYDRSGNAYVQHGRDWAGELKNFLEKYEDGTPTGWTVELMSRNQSTITQQEEFTLVNNMLGEVYKALPRIHIDKYQCQQLISSMNVAKQIVKANNQGVRQIFKDKSSEKLPMHKRPMYSTNMSDAFKYFIYRPEFIDIQKNKFVILGDPGMI